MTVLGVLTVSAVLESTLPSSHLSYKYRTKSDGFGGFGGSAFVAISVVMATRLEINLPFPTS